MSATLSRFPPKSAWAPVRYSQTALGGGTNAQGVAFPGGLDLTTPSLRLQSGALRDVLNFEVAPFGGYARVDGYERYDGNTSPSIATYTIVQLLPTGGAPGTPGDPGNPGDPGTPGDPGIPGAHAFILDTSHVDSTDEVDGPGPVIVPPTPGTPPTPPTPPTPGTPPIPAGNLILPAIGAVVTQAVTGAFGTVIATQTVAGTPTISYLVLTMVSGVFDTTHPISAPGILL